MTAPEWHPESCRWAMGWWESDGHVVTLARCEVEMLEVVEQLHALLEPFAGDPDSDPGPELREQFWALWKFSPRCWWVRDK